MRRRGFEPRINIHDHDLKRIDFANPDANPDANPNSYSDTYSDTNSYPDTDADAGHADDDADG